MSEGAIEATAAGNGAPAIDTTQVDPQEFAKTIATATDEQLSEAMSGPMREQILTEIFRRMQEHFRPEAARDAEAVIHWRIGGRPDGGHDEFETVIAANECKVRQGFEHDDARVAFTIGGADFLRLVTGNAAGPMLFMSGKLKIEGDMMFAAQAASLFTIPNT